MASYRLYRLDGAGRISGAAELVDADNDVDALSAARAAVRRGEFELWQGRRLVSSPRLSDPA